MASSALLSQSCNQCGETVIRGMVRCRGCGSLLPKFPAGPSKISSAVGKHSSFPPLSPVAHSATADPYESILAQAEWLLRSEAEIPRPSRKRVHSFEDILACAPDYDASGSPEAVMVVAKRSVAVKKTPPAKPKQVLPVPVVTNRPLVQVVKVNMGFPVEPPEVIPAHDQPLSEDQKALMQALDEFRYDSP